MPSTRFRRSTLLATLVWAVASGLDSSSAAQPAKGETSPVWTVLDPVQVASSGGSTLTKQPDGSVLASGKHPSPDTYTITAHTKLTGIKAVRLEMLPDPSLGNRGPGRAPHGNFVLNEIRLMATPLQGPGKAVPVAFRKATANYSQPGYGVTGAIDGHPDSAWAVDPHYGKKHGAVFETQAPFGFAEGTLLTFSLDQSIRVPGHGLGRFRLSVTTAEPPVALELLDLSPKDLELAWADLASTDGVRAALAVEALVLSRQALGYLQKHLKSEPVQGDTRRIAQLIKDLDDNKFAVREQATAELEKLGPLAAPALAQLLLQAPSAEASRRADRLLKKSRNFPALLRAQRGVEVLERLGTADARRLLEHLANGPAEAWLTQEARAATARRAKGMPAP